VSAFSCSSLRRILFLFFVCFVFQVFPSGQASGPEKFVENVKYFRLLALHGCCPNIICERPDTHHTTQN